MKKIVFVCTGNACRSVAGEYILRKMLADNHIQNIETASVGTMDWGENPRDEMMVKVAAEHGYTLKGTTTYMTSEILDAADLIIVMTQHHRDQVTSLLKYANWNRIHLLMDYCFGEQVDLEDPRGQTEAVYKAVFEKIEEGCLKMVEKLK